MRKIWTLCLLACGFIASAQCENGRFTDFVFANASVTQAVPYGNNFTFDGEEQELLLDIYEPAGDTASDRPLVIMCHGGSFVAGSRDGIDVVDLCNELARMGYVVASITYRLGIPFSLDVEPELTRAVWRATHDAKAAVRYFRQNAAGDNLYRIDSDEIYMMGSSAGGFIALHHAYLTEDEEIPASIDQTAVGMGGGLEGESGNAGFSSVVKGIVNIAGAIKDTTWMTTATVPVLSLHGTADETVPYDTGSVQVFGIPVAEVDGSKAVHDKAEMEGIVNCFKTFEGAPHVPHVDNATYRDTTLSYTSNFLSHLHCNVALDCNYREIEDLVSVDELDALADVTVYPNPTADQITIQGLEVGAKVHVEIVDLNGRVLAHENLLGNQTTLDLSAFAKGTYTVRLISEDGERSLRVVRE